MDKIWNSKSLKRKEALKSSPIPELQKIRFQISELERTISKRNEESLNHTARELNEVKQKLQGLSTSLEQVKLSLKETETPRILDLLNTVYNQAIDLEGKLSADVLNNQELILREKLNISEKALTAKGIETLVLHYLFQNIKGLLWLPPMETFVKIIEQKIGQIKGAGSKAEIPLLRDAVCNRLGISEDAFDSMLTKAWDNGLVDLESGVPIGRSQVKYLETKAGSIFF